MGNFICIFSDSGLYDRGSVYETGKLHNNSTVCASYGGTFVNILLGLGTVWLALDMGKRLFDRRKAWIFAAFVGLLPGSLFVFTYVNCDALAVFSTAVIVYAWVRYLTEGWTYKNCIILAIGVAVCTLSYYNAYGFILCSIFSLA